MTRHGQHQDTGDGSDGRDEVAGQDLPVVSTEPSKAKVRIDQDRDGWHYYLGEGEQRMASMPFPSYPEAVRRALAAGHEIDNAGWRRKLLSWNFSGHAIDGYPEWEIERDKSPAFLRLAHKRGPSGVESYDLANAWDDVAHVDFYQRDWTRDGIPFVREGETYWSGWWFATIAERDRFVQWATARGEVIAP